MSSASPRTSLAAVMTTPLQRAPTLVLVLVQALLVVVVVVVVKTATARPS